MATISSTLRLDDQLSNPLRAIQSAMQDVSAASSDVSSSTMSVENAIQKSMNTMMVAAANIGMYEASLAETQNALVEIQAELSAAELAQRQFDDAVKSGDPQAYMEAYGNPARRSAVEIEKLMAKQDKLNGTLTKTEVSLLKANSAYDQQKNNVERLNQKLSEMQEQNNQIQKQGREMKNPFQGWGGQFLRDIMIINKLLRFTRLIVNGIKKSFNAVMGATEEWEGVTNKYNKSIEKVQKSIGEKLLPLAAIGSDLVAQAFDWMGQKAISAIEWINNNINLVINGLTLFGTTAVVVAAIFIASWAIANWPLLALIAVLVMVTQGITETGATAGNVAEFIGGIFGWLYGVIHNIIANLWNAIASFVEFFANVWNDPIGAVARLFFDVFDSILGIVETVASAIGHLLGQDWSSGIAEFRQNLTSAVRETYGEAAFRVERMAMIDERITYQTGREYGRNIGDKLSGIEDKLASFDLKKYSDGKAIKTTGDVKISTEDMKMLLDIATRDFQAYFQTLTPTIVLEGMVVHETADVNQVIEIMADWVEEAAESSLVG